MTPLSQNLAVAKRPDESTTVGVSSRFEQIVRLIPAVVDFLEPVSLRRFCQVSTTCAEAGGQSYLWRRHVAQTLGVRTQNLPRVTARGNMDSKLQKEFFDAGRYKELFRGLELYKKNGDARYTLLCTNEAAITTQENKDSLLVTRLFIDQYLSPVVEAQKALKMTERQLHRSELKLALIPLAGLVTVPLSLFAGFVSIHYLSKELSRSPENAPVSSFWINVSTCFLSGIGVIWFSLGCWIVPMTLTRARNLQEDIVAVTRFWELEMFSLQVLHNLIQQRSDRPNLLEYQGRARLLEFMSALEAS